VLGEVGLTCDTLTPPPDAVEETLHEFGSAARRCRTLTAFVELFEILPRVSRRRRATLGCAAKRFQRILIRPCAEQRARGQGVAMLLPSRRVRGHRLQAWKLSCCTVWCSHMLGEIGLTCDTLTPPPDASRLTSHASRLTPHVSRLTSHACPKHASRLDFVNPKICTKSTIFESRRFRADLRHKSRERR